MDIALLISAILCVGIYSYLYKDNLFFRTSEHIVVGVVTGHIVVMGLKSINDLSITPLLQGEIFYVIPVILGLLLFLRYFKKYAYISTYPLAILVGLGTGYTMRSIIKAQLIGQLKGVTKSIVVQGSALGTLNNILIVVGVVCTLSFFLFTKELKGILKPISTIGRWFMMICFGATIAGKALMFSPQVVTVIKTILLGIFGIE